MKNSKETKTLLDVLIEKDILVNHNPQLVTGNTLAVTVADEKIIVPKEKPEEFEVRLNESFPGANPELKVSFEPISAFKLISFDKYFGKVRLSPIKPYSLLYDTLERGLIIGRVTVS